MFRTLTAALAICASITACAQTPTYPPIETHPVVQEYQANKAAYNADDVRCKAIAKSQIGPENAQDEQTAAILHMPIRDAWKAREMQLWENCMAATKRYSWIGPQRNPLAEQYKTEALESARTGIPTPQSQTQICYNLALGYTRCFWQ